MRTITALALLAIIAIQLLDNDAEAAAALPVKFLRRCRCKGSGRRMRCPTPLVPTEPEDRMKLDRCLCKKVRFCGYYPSIL